MARSRRRSSSRPRVRKDWTYNPLTYVAANISIASGTIAYQPLTFSQQAQRQQGWGPENALAVTGQIYSGAAFPERSGQQIFAVDGDIHIEPSAWAVGNYVRFGWRLAIFDMEPTTAGSLPPLNYSMFQSFGTVNAYTHANSGFLAERRLYRGFGDGDTGWQMRVSWRSSRGIRIGPNKALYLILEAANDSVSLRTRPYVRTLQRSP